MRCLVRCQARAVPSISIPRLLRSIHMELGGESTAKPQAATNFDGKVHMTAVAVEPRESSEEQTEESQLTVLDGEPYTKRDALIEEVEERRLAAIAEANAQIPFPEPPESQLPQRYLRVKRHAKLYKFEDDHSMVLKKDNYVSLPPTKNHPWVENCPVGPNIVHGDGQIRVVGHGEVGWDEGHHWREYPRSWRGFEHFTTIGMGLPSNHGDVRKDTIVKHSLQLTGRGLFAQKDIKAGERIMVVASQSVNIGYNSEVDRLCEMARDVLLWAYQGTEGDKKFLHEWILTCQLSSLVELWPGDGTKRVLDMIGGKEVLDALELHEHHVARLASILELNSFLVENYFAEKKGMVFFAEAAVLNHSCCPNADYDIVPVSSFAESPFCDKAEDPETAMATDNTDGADIFEYIDPTQPIAAAEGSPKEVIMSDEDFEDIEPPARYLFCCKTNRDIKAGEEILIAYVPPAWRFEDRQWVLHDRYRFWCKCPKCSFNVDLQFKKVPKVMVVIIVIFSLLQLLVYQLKEDASDRWGRAVRAQDTGEYNINA